MKIQLKIVLIYLCTIIIIMLVSGTYIVYSTEQSTFGNVQETLVNKAEYIEEQMRLGLDGLASQIGEQHAVYILNNEGEVVRQTGNKYKVGSLVKEEVVIRVLYTNASAMAEVKHFSSLQNNGYTNYAHAVYDEEGQVTYMIYIEASTEDVHHNIMSIIRTIAIGLVLAMFITAICAIIFAQMITAPIKTLTNSSKKLAAGNWIERIPVEAGDEIGELTQSFNYMASQLTSTMEIISSEKNKLEKIFEHMAEIGRAHV